MAKTDMAVSSSSPTVTPYQLNVEQTLKAAKALLHHVQKEAKALREKTTKKDLLGEDDSDSEDDSTVSKEQPIWLNLTTKKHIVDKFRLKPSKISVPHSLNNSSNLSICLVTADPQRAMKNTVAHETFPKELFSKINKIIGYSKLKARYQTFESRRQLLSEYDIFLADERIINRLVQTLGKVFYKGTAKRPIPIDIAQRERVNGKNVKEVEQSTKKPAAVGSATFASPEIVAREIYSALNAVPISLKPGTSVAVRVGRASFTPEQLAENISTAAEAVITKHVVKGWRNVKAIHIKSPTSAAVPIWLADDMWVGDDDVLEDAQEETQPNQIEPTEPGRKRKRNPKSKNGPQSGESKKSKIDDVQSERDLEKSAAAARKVKLAEQKKRAFLAT